MCKNCGKQFHFHFSSSFGILARAGTSELAPVNPRAVRQELSARVQLLLDRAGLSPIDT
jgi:hypothetical protein